jgi:hypothetical protein
MHMHSRCGILVGETPRVTIGLFRHIWLVNLAVHLEPTRAIVFQ